MRERHKEAIVESPLRQQEHRRPLSLWNLLRVGVVALWLTAGVPANVRAFGKGLPKRMSLLSAARPTQVPTPQAPGHPLWEAGSAGGIEFWIVYNVEVLAFQGRGHTICIFVEPEALTTGNVMAIFRHFSEQYYGEGCLGIDVVTNDEQVHEAETSVKRIVPMPFGNVLAPTTDRILAPERSISADYDRSDLTESFHCYACLDSGGQAIAEDFRTVPADCLVHGEGPIDLVEAAQTGCEDTAVWLLDRGIDPNAKAPSGAVPLVYAAVAGNAEIVKLLLERGADANLASPSGWTPLIAAAFRSGSGTTIDLLLRHGAAVNHHSQDGTTALMFAVRHQDREVVTDLLARGADVNAVDGYGKTPLRYAEAERRPDMVELLKAAGALP